MAGRGRRWDGKAQGSIRTRGRWLVPYCFPLPAMRVVRSLWFPVLLAPLQLVAQKTDTIHLFNGDKIVGEMKDLKLGLLRVKTDYMSSVYIEWDQIQTVRTNKRWDIRTRGGAHFSGHIAAAPELDHVYIRTDEDPIHIGLIEIVSLYQLNKRFLARMDGALNAGYSYQRSNELSQLNLNGNATYLGDRGAVSMSFSSITTVQEGLEDNRKQDISGTWEIYLWNDWVVAPAAGAESNTELDLDLRLKLNLSLGNYLVHGVHATDLLGGGLQANRESSSTGTTNDNLEVYLGNRLRVKTYRFPKLMINIDLAGYYGLTIVDRYRASVDLSFQYEVIRDLQLGIQFYEQYDSKPLEGGPPLNDFRVATTVGYTF